MPIIPQNLSIVKVLFPKVIKNSFFMSSVKRQRMSSVVRSLNLLAVGESVDQEAAVTRQRYRPNVDKPEKQSAPVANFVMLAKDSFCLKSLKAGLKMFVYFIQCGKKGPIKVGVANNVDERLSTLQTGCPIKLIFIHKFNVDGNDMQAYNIESHIHKILKKQRIYGEWFFLRWYVDQILKTDQFNVKEIFSFNRVQKYLFESFGSSMGKHKIMAKTIWH
ncbi:MAG: GIY-YIG nuclease family protein [Spirochaetia bacterium]|nr:GIY-YIG nuclease family protein [Spirochaetia bacterium]